MTVMMYVRYPLSLRNVEDLLAELGIDVSYETIPFWWNRSGPIFAAEIAKKWVTQAHGFPRWRRHLAEVFVKINGKQRYPWRAVDHEGEVLDVFVTSKRDKAAALEFWKRILKIRGRTKEVVTDRWPVYGAAMAAIGGGALLPFGVGY
jgi:putative transposase